MLVHDFARVVAPKCGAIPGNWIGPYDRAIDPAGVAFDPGVGLGTPKVRSPKLAAAATATGALGVLALSGCGVSAALFNQGSAAVISVLPFDGAEQASVDGPLLVDSSGGQLVSVNVIGPDGEVAGRLSSDKSRWTSHDESLEFDSQYRVVASAVDEDGNTVERDVVSQTIKPAAKNSVWLAFVDDGDEIGVGMPLRVEFDKAVEDRASVERALEVRTSRPIVGAWSWDSDGKAVTFRPAEFWPAHTRIKLVAGLKGVETSPGVFGSRDFTVALVVGSRMVSEVDAETLEMTVRKDGEVIETIPVTTGKYGFETRSGVKPIMAKEGTVVMDAATGGTSRNSSEYYRLTVHNSMRLTWSGEFVHSAPWSTGSQGRRSVSHGCIGMSSYAADWFYDLSKVGDVVTVINTGRDSEAGNGITDWMVKWKDWLAKSETKQIKTTVSLRPPPKQSSESDKES